MSAAIAAIGGDRSPGPGEHGYATPVRDVPGYRAWWPMLKAAEVKPVMLARGGEAGTDAEQRLSLLQDLLHGRILQVGWVAVFAKEAFHQHPHPGASSLPVHPVHRDVAPDALDAMTFLWLAIDDEPSAKSPRDYIECNAIRALEQLQQGALDPPSAQCWGLFLAV